MSKLLVLPPVTKREFNTIIGALRLFQYMGMNDSSKRPPWLNEIVEDCEVGSLTEIGIDRLCMSINNNTIDA